MNTLRNWANRNKVKYIKVPGGQHFCGVEEFLDERAEAVEICYCSFVREPAIVRKPAIVREPAIYAQKLSKISGLELTLKEKDFYPFWNEQCGKIASGIYLPTETDYVDFDSISLNGLLKETMERSWFSTKLISHQNKSLPITFSPYCMPSTVGRAGSEVVKTKLLRISPTDIQKQIFKHWTDVSRFVFNTTIDYIRSCVGWTPSWYDIKKDMDQFLPRWCKVVPFQIKGIAIKEACNAFWKAKGHPTFRSRKSSEQSCFIPSSAIKKGGIYLRISGKGLYFHESLPEVVKDSRLIWRYEKWWLAIPFKEKLLPCENQAGRIVALDPGIRSFITFYSPNYSGNLGKSDFSRIQRLCAHLDILISKRDLTKNLQKRRSLTKASRRIRAKIKNLITELHHKIAKFLTDNFDTILLPSFETKTMVSKSKRKLRKKSVRSMLTFGHYKFKQFLKWKAFQTGKEVIGCCEAYTSKTHPETGEIKNIGSSKWIKLLNGSRADRDIVGARNIFLRALVDPPIGFSYAVSKL